MFQWLSISLACWSSKKWVRLLLYDTTHSERLETISVLLIQIHNAT